MGQMLFNSWTKCKVNLTNSSWKHRLTISFSAMSLTSTKPTLGNLWARLILILFWGSLTRSKILKQLQSSLIMKSTCWKKKKLICLPFGIIIHMYVFHYGVHLYSSAIPKIILNLYLIGRNKMSSPHFQPTPHTLMTNISFSIFI